MTTVAVGLSRLSTFHIQCCRHTPCVCYFQSLDTNQSERQWIYDHLGHTMNVHQTHYRQSSDILERVDVAKVLLIQDFGVVNQYIGKRLQDIQMEGGHTQVVTSTVAVYLSCTISSQPDLSCERNEHCLSSHLEDIVFGDSDGQEPAPEDTTEIGARSTWRGTHT